MNSLWLSKNEIKKFPKLEKDLQTDICIIGAGIFGITTAYYLSKKGYNVVVLEMEQKLEYIKIKMMKYIVLIRYVRI